MKSYKRGDVVIYQGSQGVVMGRWGSLLGCPNCTELVSSEKPTPCCNRKPISAVCDDVFDVFVKGKGMVSIHRSNLSRE